MARSVDDCEAMMHAWLRSRNDVRAVVGPELAKPSVGKSLFELDGRTPTIPWRGSEAPTITKQRLRVGYVDGTKCPLVEPVAAVTRAVQEVFSWIWISNLNQIQIKFNSCQTQGEFSSSSAILTPIFAGKYSWACS